MERIFGTSDPQFHSLPPGKRLKFLCIFAEMFFVYLFSSSFVTQKGTYYTNIALYLRLFCISTFGTFRSISFLSTALGFSIMWLNHSLFNNLLMRDIKCVASQYTMLI